jgi:hypothetical protein
MWCGLWGSSGIGGGRGLGVLLLVSERFFFFGFLSLESQPHAAIEGGVELSLSLSLSLCLILE